MNTKVFLSHVSQTHIKNQEPQNHTMMIKSSNPMWTTTVAKGKQTNWVKNNFVNNAWIVIVQLLVMINLQICC